MSFDGLLIDHMKVVTMTPADWMETSESVADAIPCRIMYGNVLIRDYKGEEVLSVAKIFCKPEHITFNHKDKLQLDDDGYVFSHPILKIIKPQNSVHVHHAEVWIS